MRHQPIGHATHQMQRVWASLAHSKTIKNQIRSEYSLIIVMPALGIEAVILFERYEQKDKSVKPDPAPSLGNAQNLKP